MKRLLFLLLVFVPLCMNAQRVYTDSIVFPAGVDTTVYIPMFDIYNWGLEVDYSALDDVDATLDLAGVNIADGSVFNRLDDDRLPFTLVDSTVAFEKSNFSFRFLALKLTVNSCTSGTTHYKLSKK